MRWEERARMLNCLAVLLLASTMAAPGARAQGQSALVKQGDLVLPTGVTRGTFRLLPYPASRVKRFPYRLEIALQDGRTWQAIPNRDAPIRLEVSGGGYMRVGSAGSDVIEVTYFGNPEDLLIPTPPAGMPLFLVAASSQARPPASGQYWVSLGIRGEMLYMLRLKPARRGMTGELLDASFTHVADLDGIFHGPVLIGTTVPVPSSKDWRLSGGFRWTFDESGFAGAWWSDAENGGKAHVVRGQKVDRPDKGNAPIKHGEVVSESGDTLGAFQLFSHPTNVPRFSYCIDIDLRDGRRWLAVATFQAHPTDWKPSFEFAPVEMRILDGGRLTVSSELGDVMDVTYFGDPDKLEDRTPPLGMPLYLIGSELPDVPRLAGGRFAVGGLGKPGEVSAIRLRQHGTRVDGDVLDVASVAVAEVEGVFHHNVLVGTTIPVKDAWQLHGRFRWTFEPAADWFHGAWWAGRERSIVRGRREQ